MRAVQLAISAGRLKKSVTSDGKIRDVVLADDEWEANTRSEHTPLSGPTSKNEIRGEKTVSLGEARARLDSARAEMAEMELAERRKELIPAADVEERLVDAFSSCRTKLLGIPSRARQQDPALTNPQILLLEALIREALEGLAGDGQK